MSSSNMVGSNAEALDAGARTLRDAAHRLDTLRRQLNASLSGSPWVGVAADRFREDWSRSHQARLAAAATRLREAGAALNEQADQQRMASEGSAGGPSAAVASVLAAVSSLFKAGTAEWWRSLTPTEQDRRIKADPESIGSNVNLPGHARDRANRLVLARERERLYRTIQRDAAEIQRNPLSAILGSRDRDNEVNLQKLDAILEIEKALWAEKDGTPRQLLMLDCSGNQVRTAISVGDVDTADNVSVFVPGFTTTVETGLAGKMKDMTNLHGLASEMGGGTVATVYWHGYDPPQADAGLANPDRSVTSDYLAADAGKDYAKFVNGLRASHEGEVHLTALGHSYGSTVVGNGLDRGAGVDDAVVFGSPGLGTHDTGSIGDRIGDAARTALLPLPGPFGVPLGMLIPPEATDLSTLSIGRDHIYVIESSETPSGAHGSGQLGNWDGVADSGVFGGDPSNLPVNHLSADQERATDGEVLSRSLGHSQYLKHGSASQYNIAAVVAGRPDLTIPV